MWDWDPLRIARHRTETPGEYDDLAKLIVDRLLCNQDRNVIAVEVARVFIVDWLGEPKRAASTKASIELAAQRARLTIDRIASILG